MWHTLKKRFPLYPNFFNYLNMDNILNTSVSLFYDIHTHRPITANLLHLLTTDKFKYDVIELRKEQDADKKKAKKLSLPSYTVSGIFKTARASSIIRPSGLICIDIDKKNNMNVADYTSLKNRLSKDPYIAYCGLSASGTGYFCIIPISDPLQFKGHFASIQEYFGNMGITIDHACGDMARKRFVSYDPEPYINPKAQRYCHIAHIMPSKTTYDCFAVNQDAEIVQKYVNAICVSHIDITDTYDKWIRIGFAFVNEYGENGRDLFHRVSQFYPRYNASETDKLYDSLLRSQCSSKPITIRTFLRMAEQACLDYIVEPI